MTAEIYGFASVLTLCACTPPLPEVLRLWDFLFAYGVHLNILCIVAQLVILRNEILNSPRYVVILHSHTEDFMCMIFLLAGSGEANIQINSPTKILRSFPPLQAETIKEVTLSLFSKA